MTLRNEMIATMIQFSAMVFAQTEPQQALQNFADALGVADIAIYRENKTAKTVTLLARNKTGTYKFDNERGGRDTSKTRWLLLEESAHSSDRLVVSSKIAQLKPDQIRSLADLHVYLAQAWQARASVFEQSLTQTETDLPACHILAPDNPYGLTQAERRICELIGAGQRPKTIASTLGASMPTVRTHLRHIYAKTQLDGMLGVLHNLQAHNTRQDIAV